MENCQPSSLVTNACLIDKESLCRQAYDAAEIFHRAESAATEGLSESVRMVAVCPSSA